MFSQVDIDFIQAQIQFIDRTLLFHLKFISDIACSFNSFHNATVIVLKDFDITTCHKNSCRCWYPSLAVVKMTLNRTDVRDTLSIIPSEFIDDDLIHDFIGGPRDDDNVHLEDRIVDQDQDEIPILTPPRSMITTGLGSMKRGSKHRFEISEGAEIIDVDILEISESYPKASILTESFIKQEPSYLHQSVADHISATISSVPSAVDGGRSALNKSPHADRSIINKEEPYRVPLQLLMDGRSEFLEAIAIDNNELELITDDNEAIARDEESLDDTCQQFVVHGEPPATAAAVSGLPSTVTDDHPGPLSQCNVTTANTSVILDVGLLKWQKSFLSRHANRAQKTTSHTWQNFRRSRKFILNS